MAKQTKAEIQKAESTFDDGVALASLAELLAKRHGKRVTLQVTRNSDGSGAVQVGDGIPYTEASLRHAVNAALAGELLK